MTERKYDDCVVIIGRNNAGEFGFDYDLYSKGSFYSLKQLTNWTEHHTDKSITNIISGYSFAIYCDDINKNYWTAGTNSCGQCAVPQTLSASTHQNSVNIYTLTQIDYFHKNNINIIKICAGPIANGIFWIDSNHNVYANGRNSNNQLGIHFDEESIYTPQHIPSLSNVIDVSNTNSFSFALCVTDTDAAMVVLEHWIKSINIRFPTEMIQSIIWFYDVNKIYKTTSKKEYELTKQYWKELDTGNSSKIIQISGNMFLEENGIVWKYRGSNVYGIADNITTKKDEMFKIDYFIEHNIQITQIKTAGLHTLVVDTNGKVYAWGNNKYGECGYDPNVSATIKQPQLIDYLYEYEIIKIDCSAYNSYCMTSNGKHFLFGRNRDNECMTNNGREKVYPPNCINDVVVAMRYGNRKIKLVSIGYQSTKLILGPKEESV